MKSNASTGLQLTGQGPRHNAAMQKARRDAAHFVDDYLPALLAQASQLISGEFHLVVTANGFSVSEWRVLATLHDSDPLTVSQLALEVLSKQPTVTKLVQRMVEQGWLKLQADASDQRRTLVTTTAAGRKLVLPLVAKARAQEAAILSTLPATQQAALKKLLCRLSQPG